jgi:hypothetical protein
VTTPSAELLRSLVYSHRLRSQVDSLDPGGLVPRALNIPFEGGTIDVDASRRIRRVLNLQVADPVWLPLNPGDPLDPYSARLRATQGIEWPDGSFEMVPVGVFRVESVEGDGIRGPVDVVAHSLEAIVIDDRFESPRQGAGVSCIALIQALILESNPAAEFIVTATNDASVPPTTWDEDRWGAIEELATAIGAEVYCDAAGRYVIADVVDPTTAIPDYVISVGEQGTLKRVSRGFHREGVYNAVVVRSSATTNTAPIQQVARDTDPSSPTRYGGPFAKVPRFWSSPLITTDAQALLAAQTILSKSLGMARAISVEALPDPTLEAGKAVRVITDLSRPLGEVHVVEAFPLRLQVGGDRFTVRTRTTTYDPPEE